MQLRKGALVLTVAGLLASPVPALAAGNVSDIEQKWLDLQKAVQDKLVQDGKLTRQEADERLAKSRALAEQDANDVVYERFMKGGKPMRDGAKDRLLQEYAALTGRTTEQIREACEKAIMTVWELAASEGKLDNLKLQVKGTFREHLQQRVQDGKLTQQEADEKLKNFERKLEEKL